MNLLALVNYMRINILDDHGGVGVDWVNIGQEDFGSLQLRWTNEEITANINEAINQVYRRVNPVVDTYCLELETGVSEYDLPSFINKIKMIKYSNPDIRFRLTEENLEQLWDRSTKFGHPHLYSTDYLSGKLYVFPTPQSDEILDLLVYRMPIKQLDWNDYSKSPELREEFQIPMLNYAAALCYMKDEANSLDPRRADSFMAKFDREFPFTSVNSNIRKSRTANKSIRYGGL